MAKLHKPQDENGINLINETTFIADKEALHKRVDDAFKLLDSEESRSKAADEKLAADIIAEQTRAENVEISLQSTVEAEINNRISAVETLENSITNINSALEIAKTTLQTNISEAVLAEQTRAENAENNLNIKIETNKADISAEKGRAEEIEQQLQTNINTACETIEQESTRAKDAENELNTKIHSCETTIESEVQRALTAEMSISADVTAEQTRAEAKETELSSDIDMILGNEVITTLSEIPTETASWTAIAVNAPQEISLLNGKKVKAIEFKTTNQITTQVYLAIYIPGNTGSRKTKLAVSKPTNITPGATIFEFNEPFDFNQKLEFFLTSNIESITDEINGDLAFVNGIFISSPASDGADNWRGEDGYWTGAAQRPKKTFHIIYHIEGIIDSINKAISDFEEKVNNNISDIRSSFAEEISEISEKANISEEINTLISDTNTRIDNTNTALENEILRAETEESALKEAIIPFQNHIQNNSMHITAEERSKWDAKPSVDYVKNAINDAVSTKAAKSDIDAITETLATNIRYKFISENDISRIDISFTDLDEDISNQTLQFKLNDINAQIIVANTVSLADNIICSTEIKKEEGKADVAEIIVAISKPETNMTSHIILDSICDSVSYNNAQHVCRVVPVTIQI